MHRTLREELVHFLSDMYSVELQALVQMKVAPDIAGDPVLAADFRTHLGETERQVERVRRRLDELGGKSSAVKEAVMKLGGKAFILFARTMPETPGRLAVHAYSYEAMEWAGYEMLRRLAEHAGDTQSAAVARETAAEERTMMERLERGFDAAERASHEKPMGAGPPPGTVEHLRKHVAEAHALEAQSAQLLERSEGMASDPRLTEIYRGHLRETREHARLLEERLHALGGEASALADAALRLGGLNWGLFFRAQSDTPAKLAAFAYAVEHLEIGAYELLRRSAARASDPETERLCVLIASEERAMAGRLAGAFDLAVQATLDAVGAHA